MKYKVTATFDAINEAMALAGVVNNINVTDCEGEEDEDDV